MNINVAVPAQFSARNTQLEMEFSSLILAVLPALRQHAMALTRHRADADDLVQSAIASALAAQDSFEIGTNFRAWMIRILRNRFFSNLRSRRNTVDIDDIPASHFGRSGGQEEHVALQDLRQHMSRLSCDQRQILLMVSVDGVSYEQASEKLGVAVGTLKCRVFRARALLHNWMTTEAHEEKAMSVMPRRSRGAGHAMAAAPLMG